MGCVSEGFYLDDKVKKKIFEKDLKKGMEQIVIYVEEYLKEHNLDSIYNVVLENNLKNHEIIKYISFRSHGKVKEKDLSLFIPDIAEDIDIVDESDMKSRKIIPDGGLIWLVHKFNPSKRYLLLTSEAKFQGSNNLRVKHGKSVQAIGNAVERLGKMITIFDMLFSWDLIRPFVTFCSGVDFNGNGIVLNKLVSCNHVQPVNKVYLFKDCKKIANKRLPLPYTMLYKQDTYNCEDVTGILLRVAMDSLDYYLKKDKLI